MNNYILGLISFLIVMVVFNIYYWSPVSYSDPMYHVADAAARAVVTLLDPLFYLALFLTHIAIGQLYHSDWKIMVHPSDEKQALPDASKDQMHKGES